MKRKDLPYYDCKLSAEEYHGMTDFVSNSMLSTWRDGGARNYEARYVTKEIPEKSTAAMNSGTIKHLAFLERERWKKQVVEIPKERLAAGKETGARSGKFWKSFELEHRGKTLLKKHEMEAMTRLVKELDEYAGALIWRPGDSEISLFWENPETGVPCRCRIDRLVLAKSIHMIFDLKSMTDTGNKKFGYQARNFNFGPQAAHYIEGVSQVFPQGHNDVPVRMQFLAVRSEAPYLPRFYHLHDETIAAFAADRLEYLADIQKCREFGNWSDPDAKLSHCCKIYQD